MFDTGYLYSWGTSPVFKWIMFPEPVIAKHIAFVPVPNSDEESTGMGYLTGKNAPRTELDCWVLGKFDFLVTDYTFETSFNLDPVDTATTCYDTSSLWSRDIAKFNA